MVHVCHYGIDLPALHLFQLNGRVEYDAYGKEVIDALKTAFLLLHLLPDAVDALCPSLYMEVQTYLCQLLAYRLNEALDVCVPDFFRGVEFFLYVVIRVVLEILQRQVLQLAFQFVKT